MMNNIKKRISSNSGETIGETLVALLIASLALMMLAGTVTSSGKLVMQSRAALNAYYESTSALVEKTTPSGTGKVSSSVALSEDTLTAAYYETTIGNKTILSYKVSG